MSTLRLLRPKGRSLLRVDPERPFVTVLKSRFRAQSKGQRGEERMKDSCSAVSKLLEKYFDQEVTGEEKSLVETHLLDCEACQEVLRSMAELRNLVRAPVEEAVEREDFQWIWQKIERGIRSEEKPTFWETLQAWLQIFPLFPKKVWIPAMAVVAIILVITVPLFFKKNSSLLNQSVIEYVESQTHNVMIYESENKKVTVIWLFEGQAKENSTS